MKILIGYDGSAYGEIILDELGRVGIPDNALVTVLTVVDVRDIPISPFLASRLSSQIENMFDAADSEINKRLDSHVEKARSDANTFVEAIKEKFPSWQVSLEAVCGKPAQEIIERADESDPDLIVVGSQGRTAVGRFLLGSVSHKVLHECRTSVRICRERTSARDSGNLMFLAVDGSDNAEAMVRFVAGRKWSSEAEFCLLAVDDPFATSKSGYVSWDHETEMPEENEKSKEWIRKTIEVPEQILKDAGLIVSRKFLWGDAANMILQETEERKPDCIFLGARGVGRIKRFFLGSVSSRVATHAECSVEIIKP